MKKPVQTVAAIKKKQFTCAKSKIFRKPSLLMHHFGRLTHFHSVLNLGILAWLDSVVAFRSVLLDFVSTKGPLIYVIPTMSPAPVDSALGKVKLLPSSGRKK